MRRHGPLTYNSPAMTPRSARVHPDVAPTESQVRVRLCDPMDGITSLPMPVVPLEETLDSVAEQLSSGNVQPAMQHLFEMLDERRRLLSASEWRRQVNEVVRRHPVLQLLHRDPLARRSFEKPRGYAGDAVMLDLVYGLSDIDSIDRLAGELLSVTRGAPASQAVRHRLEMLRDALELLAARKPGVGRALALASGHLREASTDAVRLRRIDSLVAYDQDSESLATVSDASAGWPVDTMKGSVRELLSGRRRFTGFDLVYAAGLFDYLQAPTASRLVDVMFDATESGGSVLFVNFTSDTPYLGYLEAVMDWFLIYRNEQEMLQLASRVLGRVDCAGYKLWRDPDGCLVYCQLTKK